VKCQFCGEPIDDEESASSISWTYRECPRAAPIRRPVRKLFVHKRCMAAYTPPDGYET
jgi:hypothetical protein